MQQFHGVLGAVDQYTVRAIDPTLHGVAVCAPLAKLAAPSKRERKIWGLLAAHITAGYRLRRELSEGIDLDEAGAVLDPDGRCQHAGGELETAPARAALRRAAVAIDRARGPLRRDDPIESVEIWRGLLDGRWSLVDRFDTDGRRFIVALENAPHTADPRMLTERERQVAGYVALGHSDKEVAYALGLSNNTVATHVASAKRKLGARTRIGLIEQIRSLTMDPLGPGSSASSDTDES